MTQRPLWDDVDPKALPPLPEDDEPGDIDVCEHGIGFEDDCEDCEDEMDEPDDDGSFPPEGEP